MTHTETAPQIVSNSLSSDGVAGGDSRLAATLAELIDVMDIAMWELDRDYRVVGCNRKAREIYGDAALGKFCYQAAAGIDAVCSDCPTERVFSGEPSGRSERCRTRINGETIFIDHIATPIKDKHGTITGALVLIVDITKHKLLAQELIAHRDDIERKVVERTRDLEASQERFRQLYEASKTNEALYRGLLDAAADAIAITAANGLVRFVNPSFVRLFGWSTEELTGQPLPFAGGFESDPASREFRQLMADGQPIAHVLTKRPTREGELRDVSLSVARYDDHRGAPAGVICSYRDVTEAKAMELQLHRAQKFEALGTMAAGIAHDFNNLLMGVQGNVSLLLLDLQTDSTVVNPEKLRNIEQYVRKGEHLTRQLLALTRNDRREMRTVDLNALLSDCASLFGQTRRELRLHFTLAEQIWPVEADAGQIEQVLLNLFVNAAHAMPQGGDLRLHTENVVLDQHDASLTKLSPGRFVKLTVTDSGHGIDPCLLEKIFDPFFTTKGKNQGTGLGLATAYSIINSHGGVIQAGNAAEGGACFTILLPASARPVRRDECAGDDCFPGSETILLVDDEEMVLLLTRDMLRRLGYNVLEASSGEETLRLFRQRHGQIDLVILDLIMPGMGGLDILRQLQMIDPGVKALACSGYDRAGQETSVVEQGFADFLPKPYTVQTLSRKIRTILDP